MRIRTFLRYLIGDRQAILEIAADRRAVLIGFLFVLSAGFAREYDGQDLLHEPWHVLLPAGASLATSLLLFTCTFERFLVGEKVAKAPLFLSAYRSFLGLFWMTAPLAWLYAIPYERFLDPVEAMRANLCTLGLVALWRVALMVRVISVLMGYGVVVAFFQVMLFADSIVLAAIYFLPMPLIDVMGGIRYSESEQLLRNTTINICFLGIFTFPVWLLGALIGSYRSKPAWQSSQPVQDQSERFSWGLLALAAVSLGVRGIVLPFTQPEQILRRQVEHDLKEGRISAALAEMSAHQPGDFPPYWDPPPKVYHGEGQPPLLDVIPVIADEPPAPWVRSIYLQKFGKYLFRYKYGAPEEAVKKLARLLKQFPEGPALVDDVAREFGPDWPYSKELKQRLTNPDADLEKK